MRILSLRDAELGVTSHDLWTLFRPFATREFDMGDAADARDWARELRRRRRKHLQKAAVRALGGARVGAARRDARRAADRTADKVRGEYEAIWSDIDYGLYALDAPRRGAAPWTWRDDAGGERRVWAANIGGTRFRQRLIAAALERLRPASVLEIGCGNGINVMLAAGRFPDIAFSGVDLTRAGIEAAQALQESLRRGGAPPAGFAEFAPQTLRDPGALARVDFRTADATALPFADGAFDVALTSLALEQMERVRPQVLREIARVARRGAIMIEPWAEVNAAFWPRLYVYWRDYWRGRVDDLAGYGLRPTLVTADFPQEAFLKSALVIAERA